jgi:hypothetical protein
MKTPSTFLAALAAVLLLNSCGVNHAMMMNQNQHSTQVHLAGNNFRVVDRVHGSASVPYIIGIGGMNRSQLFEQAYTSMLEKANLKEGARVVVNVVTEEHVGGVFPFYFKRTVTVSSNVVEFNR